MSTPTMQDVADLEARVEELEERLGIADDAEPEITEGGWTIKLGDSTTEIPGKFIEVTQTTPAEEKAELQTELDVRNEVGPYLQNGSRIATVRQTTSGEWLVGIVAVGMDDAIDFDGLFALGWYTVHNWAPMATGDEYITLSKEAER